MRSIAINGKFLSAKPTGVHRVAEELLAALGQLIEADKALQRELEFRVLKPKNADRKIAIGHFQHQTVGVSTWQIWEQFELPFYGRQSLLLSLCNLSPIRKSNAITMIHDAQVFISPESYSKPFAAWYQFALPRIGRANKKILTVSHYSKEQLVKYNVAPPNKIEVIHNGVEHILKTTPDDSILSKLNLRPRDYSVGLANTQAHKNLKVAIEAYARPELQNQKLVLFGSATRESFREIGVSAPDNVIFAGFVSDHELRSLLEHANAILFPSLTEGFGLPPLEAMLLGTPAICAPCGALPEVCGDAAEYAPPENSEIWAEKINALSQASAAERESRMKVCQKQAQTFTWNAAAKKLLTILLESSD